MACKCNAGFYKVKTETGIDPKTGKKILRVVRKCVKCDQEESSWEEKE